MSQANVAPPNTTRTEPKIGHVVEDQRSGDRRLIIYVDGRVVLTRDEAGNTTLTPRTAFEATLGNRHRLRRDAEPTVDAGQYGQLRDLLATYRAEDGRKADHKAAALREALDLLAGESDDQGAVETDDPEASTRDGEDDPEVTFENVPGIGPETAGKLRTQGFVTEGDVRSASDEDLLAVSGLGPSSLENLREYLA